MYREKNKNTKFNKQPNSAKFTYSLIASAILGLSPALSVAQESANKKTEEAEVEVITVKGTRGNMISAQNMKREGDTVLDAISAVDIGSLPDRSVLEAITRLPGVAIERFAGANDPDHFGVEGSGVVVRGLTHVRSEFNGRDTFSVNSGRGLSFQDVSPELVGSVEVFKNQTASMIEGGIAGTVNLNTRKPFDSDKQVVAFTLDNTYGDMRKENTPSFSGLYSNNFETDLGRFGILLNYAESELKVRSHGNFVGRYDSYMDTEGSEYWMPRGAKFTQNDNDRERQGAGLVVQWENPSQTVRATAEYIRSDSSLSWAENAIESAEHDKPFVAADGVEFEFDESGLFERGVISSDAGWRGSHPEREPGGVWGVLYSGVSRTQAKESLVEDYSLNLKWTPNDSFSLVLDAQYVDAHTELLDLSVFSEMYVNVGLDNTGGGIPDISVYGPTYKGGETGNPGHMTSLESSRWYAAMDHAQDNEGDELALQADAEYVFDKGIISSIEFGVRYSERAQVTRQSKYNWGNLSASWNENGGHWFDDTLSDEVEVVEFEDFDHLHIAGGNQLILPAMSFVKDYDGTKAAFAGMPGGWTPLDERGSATGYFIDSDVNETLEKAKAVYVQANFESDIGDMPIAGNFGLRYVKLENETKGFLIFPDWSSDPQDSDDFLNFLPADQKAFGNGFSSESTAVSEYTNVLPSVNVKLGLTDDLILRFGFSEAIALPDLGLLRNYVSIDGDYDGLEKSYSTPSDPAQQPELVAANFPRLIASSGNPNLKPMESYNYDLSLEWYFAEAGSLTTSLFHKDLTNYFIKGSYLKSFENNGAVQDVEIDGAINGGKGEIQGYELAYSQFYDFLPGALSGIGMQLNYTYIHEEGSPNSGLSNDKADVGENSDIMFEGLPLEGLSKHNYNIVGMYEKYGINARVAYNWRSDYLLTSRDVILTTPVFNEDMGQLDASIFFDLNEHLKIGLQGTNLTDSVTKTSTQINQEGLRADRAWFRNDRRYSLIVKGMF